MLYVFPGEHFSFWSSSFWTLETWKGWSSEQSFMNFYSQASPQTPHGATLDLSPAARPPNLEYLAQIAHLLPLIVLSVNQ